MACEDILANLNAAKNALQALQTGAQVVVIVDAFRSRVEYTPAKKPELIAYVAYLQAQYNACMNPNGPVIPITRPIRFVF
jgi:hypothetical protein